MKRLLAILLSLTMLVSAAPLSALAASDNHLGQTITVTSKPDADLVQAIASDPFLTQANSAPTQAQSASVETSDVSMTATNSFGKLLLDGMNEENGTNFSSNNRVIGIIMNGSTATVKYVAEEDADLVVAIYADDAEQEMVASGTVAIDKTTDGTVKVAIVGEIPDYYIIKGYLLDKAEHAPLCEAFTNTSNTKDMVDLAGATVNDFPEDRVINLDDDAKTNFAVVKQDVTLLTTEDAAAGKNNITNQDDNGLNYTIANASAEIRNLQVGDILTYEYAPGELLVVKVASIAVNGDTVTIHGDDTLEVTDVFSALKIEDAADSKDMTYDEHTADAGVAYLGEYEEDFSIEDEWSPDFDESDNGTEREHEAYIKSTRKFELKNATGATEGGVDTGEGTKVSAECTGTVSVSTTATVKYYVTPDKQYFSFVADAAMAANVLISGKIETRIRLGSFGVAPIPGLYIGFDPTFVAKAEVKLTVSVKTSTQIGFAYDSIDSEAKNLSKTPHTSIKTSVEGMIYVGIDLCPNIKVLGAVAKVELTAEVGGKATISIRLKSTEIEMNAVSKHGCNTCYTVALDANLKVSVKLSFLNLKKFTLTFDFVEASLSLGKAYWAPEYDDLGWGDCPHTKYRMIIMLIGCDDPTGAEVYVSKDGEAAQPMGTIDDSGYLKLYLDPGKYQMTATVDDVIYRSSIFTIRKSDLTVKLSRDYVPEPDPDPDQPDTPDPDKPDPDNPGPDISGESEPDYVLENGVLTINSEKIMMDYTSAEETPWYKSRDSIRQIVVKSGVQKISPYAFAECANVTNVIFEGTLTEIAASAFEGCQNLELVDYGGTQESWNSVVIGEKNEPLYTAIIQCRDGNITPSEAEMKSGTCGDNLKWTLNYQGVLTITGYGRMTNYQWGTSPWYGYKVKQVILKAEGGTGSIDSLGDYAFAGCDKLTSINIPNRVRIAYHMFDGCSSLETVVIPDEVTWIESGAFNNCTSLKTVVLPVTMEYINSGAFAGCTSLESITLPTGIRVIESNVFSGCTSLESVAIPSDIQEVRTNAFLNCSSLKELEFKDGLTTIKDGAFSGCESLTKITLPESVTSVGQSAFSGCKSLENVTLPEKIAAISRDMFSGCVNLKSVTIPQNVTSIGHYTFYGCESLNEIYYKGTQKQWNAITLGNQNNALKNATIHCTDGDIVPTSENSITAGKTTTDSNTLHAVFNGLTAGEDYAVIVSKSAENPLDAGNLIYINQKTVGANGVLDVPFISSESDAAAYVVACRKGGSTNPGGNPGKDDSGSTSKPDTGKDDSGSTSKPGGDKSDTTKPSTPEQPSSSGGGGGAIVAVVLIGGAAAAVTAGVILMMPVEISGVAQLDDGSVLANATVQLMKDGQPVAQTTTDEAGHFALEVKRGEYQMNVTTLNPETGEQTVRTASVKAPAKNANFVF